jgi:hypothetical protein
VNKSEQVFLTWCSNNYWLCEKIPEDKERSSDYRINISGITIYAEVKEIVDNEEEKKVLRQLAENRISDAFGEEPGKTVRKKINNAYHQIKRFASRENCPGILVLYNNSELPGLGRIDDYNVLTGMFGLQTIPVAIPKDPSIRYIYEDEYFGPKKSVTPTQNRYLSGIMTLYEHYEKGLLIFFYHNPHAKYPINTQLISVNNCIQYRLSSKELNWELIEEIVSVRE